MGLITLPHEKMMKAAEKKKQRQQERLEQTAERAANASDAAYNTYRRDAESDAAWDAHVAGAGPESAYFMDDDLTFETASDGRYGGGMFEEALMRSQGYAPWMANSAFVRGNAAIAHQVDQTRQHAQQYADKYMDHFDQYQGDRADKYRSVLEAREAERDRRLSAQDEIYLADRDSRNEELAGRILDVWATSTVGLKKAGGIKNRGEMVSRFMDKHNGDVHAVLADPQIRQMISEDPAAQAWLRQYDSKGGA